MNINSSNIKNKIIKKPPGKGPSKKIRHLACAILEKEHHSSKKKQPFSKKKVKVIDVEIPLPKENQILVKNLYSSICHTQLGEYLMKRGEDKYLPHCLGHEGVAKVISVGSNVKKIKRNDHVVMSWIKGDGHENGGTKYFSKKFGEIKSIKN